MTVGKVAGWIALGIGGIWLLGADQVRAGYLYAPPNKGPIQESNSQHGTALGNGNGTADRFQQVYHAKIFTDDFAGPVFIQQIAFRPDGSVADFPLAFSFADIEIGLSTTGKAPSGLSTTFEDNLGADYTIIHTGPLNFESLSPGPVGGPHPFDFIIDLAAPFYYDPSLGNLLLDIRNLHDGSPVSLLDAQQTNGNTTSSLLGLDDAPTGTTATLTLATRFEVLRTPEPGCLVLLGTGMVGLAAARWRRRTRPVK